MPSLILPCMSLLDVSGTTSLRKRSRRSPSLFLSTVILFILITSSHEEKLDQHQYDTDGQCTVRHVEDWEIIAENQHVKDRKSTRLNSSHVSISYAVFCLKKK